jgi:nitrobindin-like protein
MDAELHADVEPWARHLLGRWVGEGEGVYPTIESFRYREEVVFGHVGKPFLTYRQATTNLATGLPAHAEVGYLRGVAAGRVELVLAHPSGIAEVAEGAVDAGTAGLALDLRSIGVTLTSTAKQVDSLERHVEVEGDTLRYTLLMGAVGEPHQLHLTATLHRTA